jgi:hypothetical protein
MWRAFGSLLLTFVAIAWAIFSLALCFFYLSALWRDVFGRFAAFYAAACAFVVCMWGAHLLLRVADRMIEPYSGPFDGSVYAASPRETFYRDWRRYAREIMRSRRYALLARTRQWEKLAALDAQMAAERRNGEPPEEVAVEPRGQRRISMEQAATFDERRRAVRRTAAPTASARPAPRWDEMEE